MTTTQTKERPILFSGPMVRAILDGRKTMTRRIVSHVAGLGKVTCFGGSETTGYDFALRDGRDMWNELREDELLARCPYGSPGDRLWVRETWAECRNVVDGETEAVHRAGPWRNENEPSVKWRPSIFMPRWASRITLQVEAMRVERLQDITEEDAIAEGMHKFHGLEMYGYSPHGTPGTCVGDSAVDAFRLLWNKINGPDSWDANPWVWVVQFSVVKGTT